MKAFFSIHKLLLPLLLIIGMMFAKSGFSQKDSVFWFSPPNVSSFIGDTSIYVRFLSYDNPANITLSIPANPSFVPINVVLPANDVDSINLSSFIADIENPTADAIDSNGIKITSDALITAYYEIKADSAKEIFSLKGAQGLGTEFYTPFPRYVTTPSYIDTTSSEIEILATEDNTTVLVTTRQNIVGHSLNASFTLSLDAGETYRAQSSFDSTSTSLSGSIVSSDKPISVTTSTITKNTSGCISLMGDQITSNEHTATDFAVYKSDASDERIYILATENGTNITIENSSSTTTLINARSTYEFILSANDSISYIQTDKPVYVWHSSGNGCNLSGTQVPQISCTGDDSYAFTRSSSDSLRLLLFVRNGFEGMFTLNGSAALIPSTSFYDLPGTGGATKVASIYLSTGDVAVDSYNIVENSGDIFVMGVTSGQHTTGSNYSFLSGYESTPMVNAGLDDTICANSPLSLNGTISGGPITGVWSTTGFGSFQNATSVLTNTYIPDPLDTTISPIQLILKSTNLCPTTIDTLTLHVSTEPIVNASADQTHCINNAIVQLDGSVTGGATTGVWSTSGSGSFMAADTILDATYIPSIGDSALGEIDLVLTSTNMGICAANTDTMKLFLTLPPVVDIPEDTLYVCNNNPEVNLSGTVSGSATTGRWITDGNGIFSPDNISLNTVYQASNQDINANNLVMFLASTFNGNCAEVRDSVIVNFTTPPVVEAGIEITSCDNNPEIILNGVVSGPTSTGAWSGGNGSYSTSNTDLNASYIPTTAEIDNGILFLTLNSTNNDNCLAESDNIQISFTAAPFANFNFTEVCLNDTTVFTDFSLPGANDLVNWNWDFDDGSNDTNQNNNHVYTQAGSYNVELIVENTNGCTDTTVKTVNVFEIPNATFTYSAVCEDNLITVNFEDNSTTTNDTIDFWRYDFTGNGSSISQNPSQVYTSTGEFDVTQIVRSNNGCLDTTTQSILIPEQPQAGFFYSTSNELNVGAEYMFLDSSANAVSYLWNFGNEDTSTTQNPSSTYFENGTYIVTQWVYNAIGCIDSIKQAIIVTNIAGEVDRLIPNAISPNNDGKNDVWKLNFIEVSYPEAVVKIFNRWGQELFSSIGYATPWDGMRDGEPVPDGTYYYIIDLKDESEKEPLKGSILVLRNLDNQ